MPAGAGIKAVWVDGKPPRYWTISGILLLVFVCLWLLAVLNLGKLGRPVPDALHPVAVLEGSHNQFYPGPLFFLVHRGLFVIMGWTFVLGVIMAFKRKMVPR